MKAVARVLIGTVMSLGVFYLLVALGVPIPWAYLGMLSGPALQVYLRD